MLSSDKYSGGVVGFRGGPCSSTAASADANVEETLVADDGKSVLSAEVSPDGRIAWRASSDVDAAFRRTVAMSQMASMLQSDHYRNEAYAAAIEKCIASFVASTGGRRPTVLDVGAGTGLLSLLSARAGAEFVHGAEQWPVMAGIAAEVVKANGPALSDRIEIHPTHSGSLGVATAAEKAAATAASRKRSPLAPASGTGASGGGSVDPYTLPSPVDVVVSEILDSALLGEGVIPSLSHAFKNLSAGAAGALTAVPLSARVYGQLVNSPLFEKWANTGKAKVSIDVKAACNGCAKEEGEGEGENVEVCLARKDWQETCACDSVPIPIHLDRLPKEGPDAVKPVSPVFLAANILFTAEGVRLIEEAAAASATTGALPEATAAAASSLPDDKPSSPRQVLRVPSLPPQSDETRAAPPANALVFWWRCTLWKGHEGKGEESIEYCTCAGCVKRQGWQDHWVQCAVPLSQPVYPSLADPEASASKDVPALTPAECYYYGPDDAAAATFGCCPQSMGAAASSQPKDAATTTSSFLVALDTLPMALVFCAAPGSAEVWPSKRMRNRAVKEGKAKKLQLSSSAEDHHHHQTALTTTPLYLDEPETCTCGLHSLYSVDRRWALADGEKRWKRFAEGLMRALKTARDQASRAGSDDSSDDGSSGTNSFNVVSLGDGAVAGLLAACALQQQPEAFGLQAQTEAADKDEGEEGDDDDDDDDDEEEPACPPAFRVLALEDSRLAAVHTDALAQAHGLEADINFTTAIVSSGASSSSSSGAAGEDGGNGLLSTAFEAFEQMCSGGGELDEEDDEEEAGGEEKELKAPAPTAPFVDALVLEPLFARMHTHPLWCAVSAWRRCVSLKPALKTSAVVFPSRARICAQAVHLTHLANNHGVVGSVCGFDHKPFDEVEKDWHTHTFTYPLWQYEHFTVSEPATEWAVLDYSAELQLTSALGKEAEEAGAAAGAGASAEGTHASRGKWLFETTLFLAAASAGAPVAHGVMFWLEWDGAREAGASPGAVLTSHPAEAPYSRQHVRFFPQPLALPAAGEGAKTVKVAFRLEGSAGSGFSFDLAAETAS